MFDLVGHFLTSVSAFSQLPMFSVGWVIFLIAACITFAVKVAASEVKFGPKAFIQHCFPGQSLKDKSTVMDAVMYSVSKMTKAVVLIGHYGLIIAVSSGVSFILNRYVPAIQQTPTALGLIAVAIVACLVWDFSNFLSHYLQHKVPFLWEIHKVHHSATQLTPFTAKRLHPLADKLDLTIGGVLVGIVFGLTQHFLTLSVPLMLMMLGNINMVVTVLALDPLRHSSVGVSFGPLEGLLVSPKMHHLHHSVERSHWDKNMGFAFGIWDIMFGTYMKPEKGAVYAYGIGRGAEEDEKYQNLVGAYIDPVRAAIAVAIHVPDGSEDVMTPALQLRLKKLVAARALATAQA